MTSRRKVLRTAGTLTALGGGGCLSNQETIPSYIEFINASESSQQFTVELSRNDDTLLEQEVEVPTTNPEIRDNPYRPYVVLFDSVIQGEEYHFRVDAVGRDGATDSISAVADCTDNQHGNAFGWGVRIDPIGSLRLSYGCDDIPSNQASLNV